MSERGWIFTTVLLCCYGFFKEFKPSEPFLTPYLKGPLKNITEDQLDEEIYPVWTYSYLVVLLIVFLITDILRYKPVIMTEAVAYLTTRALLIWGMGVLSMQMMQVAYGVATGTEVAYYTYIYAVVERKHFQKVTSYTRGAVLLGRMMAGVVGQLLVSFHVTGYLGLNYVSFASVVVCVIISICLPSARGNAFIIHDINAQEEEQPLNTNSSRHKGCFASWKLTMKSLLNDFFACYSRKQLLRWSLWWAFATCGELQVENYIQNLWDNIAPSHSKHVYNGGVNALSHLACAAVAFLLAFTKLNWSVCGELVLAVVSIVDSFLLYTMARTSNIWLAYGTYIIFRTLYTFLITIASFQIAVNVDMTRYALVFGCNTFMAVFLQTIFTIIVNDEHGLHLGIVIQFVVYGCYFLLIGAVFLFMAVVTMTSLGWRNCWSQRFVQSSQGPPPEEGLSSEERPPLGGRMHASDDQSGLLPNEEVPNYAV